MLRDTGLPGNDHNQRIYVLRCGAYAHEHGANGADIGRAAVPPATAAPRASAARSDRYCEGPRGPGRQPTPPPPSAVPFPTAWGGEDAEGLTARRAGAAFHLMEDPRRRGPERVKAGARRAPSLRGAPEARP